MEIKKLTHDLLNEGGEGSKTSCSVMTDRRQSLDSSMNPAFLTPTRCSLEKTVVNQFFTQKIWKPKTNVTNNNIIDNEIGGETLQCLHRQRKSVLSPQHLYNLSRITRFATVNVDTFLQTGRACLVLKELSRYQVDLAGLQEVRWAGSG